MGHPHTPAKGAASALLGVLCGFSSSCLPLCGAPAQALVSSSFPSPTHFGLPFFPPRNWVSRCSGYRNPKQEALSSSSITVQLWWERQTRSVLSGGDDGLCCSPLARELPGHRPATSCYQLYQAPLYHCCPEHSNGWETADSPAQAFSVLLPSSLPDFPAFSPAVIKRMSYSSVQLFLLECEGFSAQTIFNRRLKFTLHNQWGTGLNH